MSARWQLLPMAGVFAFCVWQGFVLGCVKREAEEKQDLFLLKGAKRFWE